MHRHYKCGYDIIILIQCSSSAAGLIQSMTHHVSIRLLFYLNNHNPLLNIFIFISVLKASDAP